MLARGGGAGWGKREIGGQKAGGVRERVEGGSRKQEGWEEKRVSEQSEVRMKGHLC